MEYKGLIISKKGRNFGKGKMFDLVGTIGKSEGITEDGTVSGVRILCFRV